MAKYTNVAVALGNQSGNGSSKTFTFSASSINSLVNNTLPSECKITRAVIQFRGAKPYSFSGKGSITITLGSYSKSYSDVIANDGGNDDFGSGDTLCTSDDIKGYINSNGRFNSDLIFKLGSSTLSTYWRVEATIYFDYETPYTVSIGAGTGGSINTTGGSYYSGTKVSVTATPNNGYKFVGWANSSGVIAVTSNPYTFTVSGSTSFNAVFEPITYNLVFDANGGSSIYDGQILESKYGDTLTLGSYGFTAPKVKFSYEGDGGDLSTSSVSYQRPLIGWEDLGRIVDPGGTVYTADTFDAPYYANVHPDLYAAFGYDKYALISHYCNNGKSEGRPCINTEGDKTRGVYPEGATITHLTNIDGETVTLRCQWGAITGNLLPAPTREGYEFLGWSDGTTTFAAGESVTSKVDRTFTAQWEKIAPEIKEVSMLYSDKQISKSNKVLAAQGFRISINVQ